MRERRSNSRLACRARTILGIGATVLSTGALGFQVAPLGSGFEARLTNEPETALCPGSSSPGGYRQATSRRTGDSPSSTFHCWRNGFPAPDGRSPISTSWAARKSSGHDCATSRSDRSCIPCRTRSRPATSSAPGRRRVLRGRRPVSEAIADRRVPRLRIPGWKSARPRGRALGDGETRDRPSDGSNRCIAHARRSRGKAVAQRQALRRMPVRA